MGHSTLPVGSTVVLINAATKKSLNINPKLQVTGHGAKGKFAQFKVEATSDGFQLQCVGHPGVYLGVDSAGTLVASSTGGVPAATWVTIELVSPEQFLLQQATSGAGAKCVRISAGSVSLAETDATPFMLHVVGGGGGGGGGHGKQHNQVQQQQHLRGSAGHANPPAGAELAGRTVLFKIAGSKHTLNLKGADKVGAHGGRGQFARFTLTPVGVMAAGAPMLRLDNVGVAGMCLCEGSGGGDVTTMPVPASAEATAEAAKWLLVPTGAGGAGSSYKLVAASCISRGGFAAAQGVCAGDKGVQLAPFASATVFEVESVGKQGGGHSGRGGRGGRGGGAGGGAGAGAGASARPARPFKAYSKADLAKVTISQFADHALSKEQLSQFARDGFLHLPGVVPPELVNEALRQINRVLGQFMTSDKCVAGQTIEEYMKNDPAVVDLALRSPALAIAESLCRPASEAPSDKPRYVQPPRGCQVAPRPPLDRSRGDTGLQPDDSTRWHIDGMQEKTVCAFSLLLGVMLNDTTAGDAGNFTVFPTSHHTLARVLRERGPHGMQLKAHKQKRPRLVHLAADGSPTDSVIQPVQVRAKPGDIILAHPMLAHRIGNNYSPHIRYACFYRLMTNGREANLAQLLTGATDKLFVQLQGAQTSS